MPSVHTSPKPAASVAATPSWNVEPKPLAVARRISITAARARLVVGRIGVGSIFFTPRASADRHRRLSRARGADGRERHADAAASARGSLSYQAAMSAQRGWQGPSGELPAQNL